MAETSGPCDALTELIENLIKSPQVKDIYPAENMELMENLAHDLSKRAKKLKPAVDKCIGNYPNGPVASASDRFNSLLHIRVDTESILAARLEVISAY